MSKELDLSHVFTNRKELECSEHNNLDRKLGVIVGYPYKNEGANGVVCDLEVEYVSVNTTSAVSWPKLGELNEKAIAAHDHMIKRIDTVIAELQAHKERLKSDKKVLVSGRVDLDALAKERL